MPVMLYPLSVPLVLEVINEETNIANSVELTALVVRVTLYLPVPAGVTLAMFDDWEDKIAPVESQYPHALKALSCTFALLFVKNNCAAEEALPALAKITEALPVVNDGVAM